MLHSLNTVMYVNYFSVKLEENKVYFNHGQSKQKNKIM